MRRRNLLALLGCAVAARPIAGAAQPAKTPTIGVLAVAAPGSDRFWRLLREDLRALGYVEGQSVRFEYRAGEVSRLPDLASELVRLNVDLIVTWFTPAALAAKRATSVIPIVMALAANPVETGLVQSLAHPGGNVTGMSGVGAELAGKCVELTREMIPAARRVAVLANALDPFTSRMVEQIRQTGEATGTSIDTVMIHNAEELEAAFPTLEKKRPDAVIVQPSLPAKQAAELALAHRLPAVSFVRGIIEEGGLMTYGVAEADAYRRAALFVDKILKGDKPSGLPVEEPTRFVLSINLNTAKALGLTVPQSLLDRADEVIE